MRHLINLIEKCSLSSSVTRDLASDAIREWFHNHNIRANENLASPIEIVTLSHTQDIRIRLRDWEEGKVAAWSQLQKMEKEFKDFVKDLGWHITMVNPVSGAHQLGLIVEIKVAPNFPTGKVEVPHFLYHFTSKKNLQSILNHGIEPRSGRDDDRYPPRVYLMLPDKGSWEAAHAIAGENAVRLKIDTGAIPHAIFYRDPELTKAGVWTYDPIPPEAIEPM